MEAHLFGGCEVMLQLHHLVLLGSAVAVLVRVFTSCVIITGRQKLSPRCRLSGVVVCLLMIQQGERNSNQARHSIGAGTEISLHPPGPTSNQYLITIQLQVQVQSVCPQFMPATTVAPSCRHLQILAKA
jgi:hypothetical protein